MRMKPKPNILLVDDEPRFINSLEDILSHYDYNCTKAFTGSEAFELLKTESFDLALLDVELPDVSGCTIADHIRTNCPDMTTIMLTGIKTVETAVQSMKMGAYDFLSKPLNHELLLKTLTKGLEHSKLKQKLHNSEEKYQILSEAAWEGIVLHENGEIIETNNPFLEMFGYSQKDVQNGLRLVDLFNPMSRAQLKHCHGNHSNKTCTIVAQKKDGTELPIETRSRLVMHNTRELQAWVMRDMSERVRAEQENLELHKKLAKANRLQALGLMAGSVAHDLNNILTGIVSYPDLLLQQMDESEKHYLHIQKIQSAGKRAAAVVSDLVAITRGGTQQKVVDNVNDLVLNYLNSLEHSERLAQYTNVTVQSTLRRDISNICCAPTHIHKVLLNLVGNAFEAVQESGTVHVTTENCRFTHPLHSQKESASGGEYVKLIVANDGPAIDEKDIDSIFNPFYSTKVMGKSGTGLGLSVVWNIIQDHEGWIEVINNGAGVAFEIYLPATQDKVCSVEIPTTKVRQTGRGEKILIVDDQKEQNEILEYALQELGYAAYSVTSGEEAIEFIKSQPVDLLLMDMIMGDGLNGRETLERIFQEKPNQRAIVVSGYAKREEIEKTRSLGVSIFLEKPVTLAKVDDAIQHTLVQNRALQLGKCA